MSETQNPLNAHERGPGSCRTTLRSTNLDKATLERVAAAVVEHVARRGGGRTRRERRHRTFLYVVRDGTMELDHKGHVVDVVTKGQVFGHPTLVTGLAPEFTVRAREDTVLYLIPRDVALEILSRPDGVTFVAETLRERLIRAAHTMRAMPDVRSVPVTSLMRRGPVFCDPTTTIREAAQLMSDEVVTAAPRPEPQGAGHRHRRRPAQEGHRRRPVLRDAGQQRS